MIQLELKSRYNAVERCKVDAKSTALQKVMRVTSDNPSSIELLEHLWFCGSLNYHSLLEFLMWRMPEHEAITLLAELIKKQVINVVDDRMCIKS